MKKLTDPYKFCFCFGEISIVFEKLPKHILPDTSKFWKLLQFNYWLKADLFRFVLYKLPRIYWTHKHLPKYVKEGHAYTYLDTESNYKFHLSKYSIADDMSAAGRTMNQIYKLYDTKGASKENFEYSDEMAHVFYNDENPNGNWFHTNFSHKSMSFSTLIAR